MRQQIPDLVLNVTGLLISCWLSWNILRVSILIGNDSEQYGYNRHEIQIYSAQAMTYVGAPEHINHIKKVSIHQSQFTSVFGSSINVLQVSLAVLSCLQLEVFILTTAMGLWIDILYHTAIQKISAHTPVYLGGFIATTIVCLSTTDFGVLFCLKSCMI